MDIFLAIIAASITAFLLFRVLFETRDEFIGCVKFWLTPDIISIFRGNYDEDYWAEFKLWIWIGCTVGIGYGVYALLH